METELKFQIPAARLPALRRAVATASARVTRLQAVYADTPDRRLAGAGLALRLRREGPVWVQALKGRGDGVASRLEHEVEVAAPARGRPAIDPARHDGSAAGAALRAALAALRDEGELGEVFRTDIRRTQRRVRSGGATIEIALDQGALVAGTRRARVCEIEFELIAGPPAALPAFAARWVERFGLWWDVRTKAERGQRLAREAEPGQDATAPTKARPSTLDPDTDPARAFGSMLRAGLAHALPNAAQVAGGNATPEHLHQLRVALRRLRSVLREFAPWCGDAPAALALEAQWAGPFAALGAARDADAIGATLLPRLVAAGAPALPPALHHELTDTGAIVRDAAFNRLLLRTLALALAAPAAASMGAPAGAAAAAAATVSPAATAPPAAPVVLHPAAATVLRRAWRRALADLAQFEQAEAATQHRTRKRLKRLRYAFEFMLPLYPRQPARRMQRALAAAGQALGELNDLQVAAAAYQALSATDPRALFALGWLAAQREHAVALAARRLRALAGTRRPWRKAPKRPKRPRRQAGKRAAGKKA